jgi:dTDP-4-dehydrorhamnose 3,5-epimerase-like enzyme
VLDADMRVVPPGLLRIPTGVWHADQNWGDFEVMAVNFPTVAYDPEHPDKYRIDVNSGEIPFDFTLRDCRSRARRRSTSTWSCS